MRKLQKFGIVAACLIAAVSFCPTISAFADSVSDGVPAGFGDAVTIDVSATNEALNRWQYYITGTLDEQGNPRAGEYYEDKNVRFGATENGRTGGALLVEKKTQDGSLVAYPYAIDVLPNQTYSISAYVKNICEQSDLNSAAFMVKELDKNGKKTSDSGEFTVLSSVSSAVSDWRKVEFMFTTSANGYKIVPKIEFKGKGDFYLDDMAIQKATVYSNSVFYKLQSVGKLTDGANDELSNADEPDKLALKGMNPLTSANISTDSSDGDGASLLLNDGEVFKTNFSALSPDKTYRLSFKYKHVKIGSKNALSIRFNYVTTAGARQWYIDVINGSSTEWLTCSVDFKGTEAYASQGLAITAYARYLIDELSIVCLDDGDPMQYIADGSFSGAYTAGYTLGANVNIAKQTDGTSVFAVGNGVYDGSFAQRGFVRYAPAGLTAGQRYTLSYDYRFTGANWINSILVFHGNAEIKNIINQEVPNGWTNATYEFTATGNDYFMFYGPSYYFWVTYYRNIKITDGSGKQYNSNVNLITPETVFGDNILGNGAFDGNAEYVSGDWTFNGDAGVYGLVFDTRYEDNVSADTKSYWNVYLNGTKENSASAISKEIVVSKRTLAVAFTCFNGSAENVVVSAMAGEKEIYADENGFIELPEGVSYIKLKFTAENYVAFGNISLSSHTHETPEAEDVTSIEATCTKAGGKIYFCDGCGKTVYLEKTELKAHDLEHVHIDATCVNGVDKDVCKVCKNEFNVKILQGNPDEHTFKEEILKAPTCVKSGMKQNVCVHCGKVNGRAIMPATGIHAYENGVCAECGAKDPDYNGNSSDDSGAGDSTGQSGSGCKSSVYDGTIILGVLACAAFLRITRKKEQ